MRVFITGATGLIGSALTRALLERGDEVLAMTRDARRARASLPGETIFVEADPAVSGDWQARIANCDAVVNLCGASIGGQRWDARYRQILMDSRLDPTHLLVDAMRACSDEERPGVLASSSGIDYYDFDTTAVALGDDDEVFDEQSPAGDTFLARLCSKWEAEAELASEVGVRVALVRTGIVLSTEGGALPRIAAPFKAFVGGPVGSGKQWFSWIHIDDMVGAYLHALDNPEVRGPINAVAPGAVRQKQFARTLGEVLGRPSFLPAPKFALKIVAGQLAEYLVNGRHAIPQVLDQSGYQFKYPELKPALEALYR